MSVALARLAAMPWLGELDEFSWVPEGWEALLDEAVTRLDETVRASSNRVDWVYVKEKLGSLRIQLRGLEDQRTWMSLMEVTEDVERRSLCQCQYCGRPGRPRDGGLLIETLCEVHALIRRG